MRGNCDNNFGTIESSSETPISMYNFYNCVMYVWINIRQTYSRYQTYCNIFYFIWTRWLELYINMYTICTIQHTQYIIRGFILFNHHGISFLKLFVTPIRALVYFIIPYRFHVTICVWMFINTCTFRHR